MDHITPTERGLNNRAKVIQLHKTGLYTNQEIADEVGISRSYVSTIIRRCKQGKPNSRLVSGFYERYNNESAPEIILVPAIQGG